MDCSTIQRQLDAHADKSLRPDEMQQIEKHLAACAECRLYAAELTKTREALNGLDDIPPPPWLTQKVIQKIRAEARPKKGLFRKLFFPLPIKLPLGAVATLLIAGAALLIMKSMGPDLKPVATLAEKSLLQTPSEKELLPKDKATSASPDQKVAQAPAPAARQRTEPEVDQPRVPAPQSTPAAPRPLVRSFETGKAPDEADRKEEGQKAASGSDRSVLSEGKIASEMPKVTLRTRDREKAIREIEAILPKLGGNLLATDKDKTGASLTIQLDPSRMDDLMRQLDRIGSIREPRPLIQPMPGNKIVIILINK